MEFLFRLGWKIGIDQCKWFQRVEMWHADRAIEAMKKNKLSYRLKMWYWQKRCNASRRRAAITVGKCKKIMGV